jgi:hypothetical protein
LADKRFEGLFVSGGLQLSAQFTLKNDLNLSQGIAVVHIPDQCSITFSTMTQQASAMERHRIFT